GPDRAELRPGPVPRERATTREAGPRPALPLSTAHAELPPPGTRPARAAGDPPLARGTRGLAGEPLPRGRRLLRRPTGRAPVRRLERDLPGPRRADHLGGGAVRPEQLSGLTR